MQELLPVSTGSVGLVGTQRRRAGTSPVLIPLLHAVTASLQARLNLPVSPHVPSRRGFIASPFILGRQTSSHRHFQLSGCKTRFAGEERKPNQATGSFKSLGEFGIIFPMTLCFCFCFFFYYRKKCTCSSSHRYIYIYLLYLRLFFDGGMAGEDVS